MNDDSNYNIYIILRHKKIKLVNILPNNKIVAVSIKKKYNIYINKACYLPVGIYDIYVKNVFLYKIFVAYNPISKINNKSISLNKLYQSSDSNILCKYTFINIDKIISEYIYQSYTFIYVKRINDISDLTIVCWDHTQFNPKILFFIDTELKKIKKLTINNIVKQFYLLKTKFNNSDIDYKTCIYQTTAYIQSDNNPEWMFYCIFISLLRAVGIPCRIISYLNIVKEYTKQAIILYQERCNIPSVMILDIKYGIEYWDGKWIIIDGHNLFSVIEFDQKTWIRSLY